MKRKTGVIGGIILVLLGALFLAAEIAPDYFDFWEWPFVIIGLGFVFLIWAILSGTGGLAVPGVILGGIGGILYYQNSSGDWASWSYIWALIPGFVGVGIILSGIIDRKYKEAFSGGLTMIIIGSIMFLAFGSQFGFAEDISQFWPVLLIGLGLIALVRAIFSGRKKKA